MADALAGGDPCAADRLADELVADAESAPLPEEYRARLLVSARSLAATIVCPQPAEEDEDRDKDEDEDKDEDGENGNGKGNGKGKGKKDKD